MAPDPVLPISSPASRSASSETQSAVRAESDRLPDCKGLESTSRKDTLARRRFQTGSLYLKGKNWMGRWREDVILSDGSVKRERKTQAIGTLAEYPTKKLARRRLEVMLARVNSLTYRPGRVATLAEFVERWRTDVLSQHKQSTIAAAESHLRSHLIPAFGACRLEEITPEAVQSFVSQRSKKLSRKTLLNVLGTLSSALNTAKKWGYVCETVDFNSLTLPSEDLKADARYFSAQEARDIIAAAPEPFATAFAVAAMTAVRPGELFGLKVEDLDFGRRTILIRRSARYSKLQTTKTRRGVRTLPMPDALAARFQRFLTTWRPNAERLLFATKKGTPISANGVVQRKLWPILDSLKIPRCGLYAFRHTHSSLLVEHGAPITVAQAQLGHSDPRLTLSVYSHVVGDSQRRAVAKIAEILDPAGHLQNSYSN